MPVSKPTLIPDWKRSWRFASMLMAAIGAAAAATWLTLTDAQQTAILEWAGVKAPGAAAFVMFLAIMFGRVFQFKPPAFEDTRPEPPPAQTEADLANLPVEK